MASKIEWTEATWNPIVGCSLASPGCTNCYAMTMAARLERMGQARYAGLTKASKAGAVWTGELRLVPEAVLLPLRRRKPTVYFVNSMSDLFHEAVPDAWIDQVFAAMALAPEHTFQILTKRSARMRAYVTAKGVHERVWELAHTVYEAGGLGDRTAFDWPARNVWLGVSAEDQRRADERVPDLLATPAAVRFVSAEPLIGPIDFRHIEHKPGHFLNALTGMRCDSPFDIEIGPALDWIIVGGESGPKARPMHPAWARQIRDRCAAEGVAFHFKQHGAWAPRGPESLGYPIVEGVPTLRLTDSGADGSALCAAGNNPVWMQRIGKKAAGRRLDGQLHDAMPEVRHG